MNNVYTASKLMFTPVRTESLLEKNLIYARESNTQWTDFNLTAK